MKVYKVGIVLLFLEVLFLSCNGIDEEPLNPDSIISLAILNTNETDTISSANANGDSTVVLVARISEDADTKIQSVTFKSSSGGSFVGLDTNNDLKRFDSERIARTTFNLPLSDIDKKFFFRAEVAFESQIYFSDQTIQLIGVKDIVTLEVLSENGEPLESPILADGTTKLRLRAKVNFNKDEFNQVVFGKSKGTFQSVEGDNATRKINSQGFADLFLTVTNEVGKLLLSAEVGSSSKYSDNAEINLQIAYPEELILEPSSTTAAPGSSVDLTVFASRSNGKVSANTPIRFKAIQIDDNEDEIHVGRFTGLSQAQTDNDGKVSGVKFFVDTNDINETKPIFIFVSSPNNQNEIIQSSVQLTIDQ